MHIRDAVESDLPAILAIYNWAIEHTAATFDLEPQTVEGRREWFAQFGAGRPLLVAERAGRIAGFAYYQAYRPRPGYSRTVEFTVYVDHEQHGRGVASQLYAALIDRANAAGMHAVVTVIAGDNPASVALHRKFGFQPVGQLREVGYKFGRWFDTTLWQRLLP